MDRSFNADEAREYLLKQEQLEKKKREEERLATLDHVARCLKEMFLDSPVEVYLVGSITKPNSFNKRSDIDVVLKNFKGDRFAVWTELESKVRRRVEVILFERSHFKEHIEQEGLKVV